METRAFETFKEVGSYEEAQLKREHPTMFNGSVCVKKYRITIEEIEEPIEVIRARIQALWDANENHHCVVPLVVIGRKYGMELSRAN